MPAGENAGFRLLKSSDGEENDRFSSGPEEENAAAEGCFRASARLKITVLSLILLHFF